jgi:hypothetical protein
MKSSSSIKSVLYFLKISNNSFAVSLGGFVSKFGLLAQFGLGQYYRLHP